MKNSIDLSNLRTFKYNVEKAVQDYPESLRKGQAIANFLYMAYSDIYTKATEAHKDCYYNDKMIDECITCCYNNIKDSIDVIVYDSDIKGDLKNFSKDIIKKMLVNQVLQGNIINIKVFQKNKWANRDENGFNWSITNEGYEYWENILGTPSKTIPRIFFKGVPERSAELRNTLINWGVKYIPDNLSFCDTFLYYIGKDFKLAVCSIVSDDAWLLQNCYKECYLPKETIIINDKVYYKEEYDKAISNLKEVNDDNN